MADPKMTRFKSMSMDEKEATIKQSTQEALRSKEEIRAAKETKVKSRGLLLTLEAQERVLVLME